MFRKCYVCGEVPEGNSYLQGGKALCEKCAKIVFAVSVAVIEINRQSRIRPDRIQIADIIKTVSGNKFLQDLWGIIPTPQEIIRDLANPILRADYLDEEKINRCFDFFEEAEDPIVKKVGSSNSKKRQREYYDFISSFPDVKELTAALCR